MKTDVHHVKEYVKDLKTNIRGVQYFNRVFLH